MVILFNFKTFIYIFFIFFIAMLINSQENDYSNYSKADMLRSIRLTNGISSHSIKSVLMNNDTIYVTNSDNAITRFNRRTKTFHYNYEGIYDLDDLYSFDGFVSLQLFHGPDYAYIGCYTDEGPFVKIFTWDTLQLIKTIKISENTEFYNHRICKIKANDFDSDKIILSLFGNLLVEYSLSIGVISLFMIVPKI